MERKTQYEAPGGRQRKFTIFTAGSESVAEALKAFLGQAVGVIQRIMREERLTGRT
jgi:hypothetical protein